MKQSFLVLQTVAVGLASFLLAGVSFEPPDVVVEPNDVTPPHLLPMPAFDPPPGVVSNLLQRYPDKSEPTGGKIHSKKSQPKHWVLRGIVQEGHHRYALVEQAGELKRLHVGDLVGEDETIIEVGDRGVKLKGLYGEKQILLYHMNKP